MRHPILLFIILSIVTFCKAQNPATPKNRLPEGAKLIPNKDTSPVRFAVSFSEAAQGAGTNAITLSKIYNLNSSEVSIGQQTITISKTGLYHFDYYIQVVTPSLYKVPVFTSFISGVFPQSSFTFIKDVELPATQDAGVYKGNWNFSVDIHIAAPSTLKLMRYVIGTTSTFSMEGKFLGHLISE